MKCKATAIILAAIVTVMSVISIVPTMPASASYVDDFLATVGPMCTNDMRENRILASFTMAQAIYESGWGRSELAVNANNLFGMRAYSTSGGKVYDRNQGVLYNSWSELVAKKGSSYVSSYSMSFWRAFDNWEESVNAHSQLFNGSSRYANLRGNYDYKSCCKLVVEDGYCTDSGYTENLIGLIESYNLEQYNYVFAPGEEEENMPPEISELYGENLFSGLTVNYYLKGSWNEFAGSTKLATDGKYRGDGSNNWNGNSAVSGVTYDTADYNGTCATTNYFCFNLAEVEELDAIHIKGYRENGNRNYASLEVFISTSDISVDADNYSSVTASITNVNYTMEKTVIQDAPQSNAVDQFFDLVLDLPEGTEAKGVLIKTNKDCVSQGFFQFDEISGYAPLPNDPFTFVEGLTNAPTVNSTDSQLVFKNGVMFAADIKALFVDKEMSLADISGKPMADTARASTGCVITTVIGGKSSSLTLVVSGDVNGDALTSTADYLQMVRHIKGTDVMEGHFFAAGDMTADNAISTTDCAIIRKLISGQ